MGFNWKRDKEKREGHGAWRSDIEKEALERDKKRTCRPMFRDSSGRIKIWTDQKKHSERLKEEIEKQKRAFYGTADGKPKKDRS